MYNETQIKAKLKEQLAIDYNCLQTDFSKKENIITTYKMNPGRRIYSDKEKFLAMVTMGDNAVISADEQIIPWLKEWSEGKRGIWLFEHDHMMELEEELQKYGQKLWQTHHMFLPRPVIKNISTNFALKWLEREDIKVLYGRKEFSNALCDEYKPERPDVLAVAAYDKGEMIGLAGCSADTDIFWQIGIDVLPDYRGHHIGTKLVQLLKNEILRRGAIPFYGTSLSNLHSWNIALNCDFYPAWIEIETKISE